VEERQFHTLRVDGSNPVVGGTVLLLLFVGIHNAWDSVTFIALHLRQQGQDDEN
jgi:hypothetical protein